MVLAGVVGVAGLAGCASASAGAAGSAAAQTPAATGATKAASDPTGTATRPPDQLATALPAVKRPTKPGQPARLKAPGTSFKGAVAFGDGVRVHVTSIKQGASKGQGPGVFNGAPRTQVALEIVNGSTKSLDLSRVVVTLLYGTPKRVASPVYEPGALDFAGTLAPGATARGTYMYSIPTADLSDVTMTVDFDGVHAAATFTGSVKP